MYKTLVYPSPSKLIIGLNTLRKYIKYLISLLLILGLAVGECSISSQKTTPTYYPILFTDNRKGHRHAQSELYVYTGLHRIEKRLLILCIIFRKLKDVCSLLIRVTLNIWSKRYQKISAVRAQCVFLNKIITTHHHHPCLYSL
ncbi:hypothetical protein [Aquimarina hainanensis]|uniref:hypothetical protein n=1 Tax=Aquimarina hainanensis TaxID=1578017 RepID=UPI00361D01E7